jgi:hypothetical protein
MRKKLTNGTIEFSVDYNLDCEDFTIVDGKGRNITENVNHNHVTSYIHCLCERIPSFRPSQHRTEGTILMNGNDMEISYRFYNLPDWDDSTDVDLGVVEIVPFIYTT